MENNIALSSHMSSIIYDRKPSSLFLHHMTMGDGHYAGKHLTIDLAESSRDCERAGSILNRMYGKRGYGSHHQIARTSQNVTFTASCDREMIGTLTLTVDSPMKMGVDATFVDELAELRSRPGASLCELTKFAFSPSPESRPLLARLFHVIFIYGTQRYDCTDLLIEVNPRHVRFYEVMLRFTKVGPVRTNRAVNAPSQLMHLKVSDIRSHINSFASCESGGSVHSLYRHFLEGDEELEVQTRIAAMMSTSCDLPNSSSTSPQRLTGWLARGEQAAA